MTDPDPVNLILSKIALPFESKLTAVTASVANAMPAPALIVIVAVYVASKKPADSILFPSLSVKKNFHGGDTTEFSVKSEFSKINNIFY